MMMDVEEMMTTVFPQAMATGMDQSKTEKQKQKEIEQLMEELLMNLLGPDCQRTCGTFWTTQVAHLPTKRWHFLSPNPPVDTDGRRKDSGRGVRKLQAR